MPGHRFRHRLALGISAALLAAFLTGGAIWADTGAGGPIVDSENGLSELLADRVVSRVANLKLRIDAKIVAGVTLTLSWKGG